MRTEFDDAEAEFRAKNPKVADTRIVKFKTGRYVRGWVKNVVAIGNAPTALFRLLELLDGAAPAPAVVIGLPVGFVGAAESKEALAADGRVSYLIVRGRRGGSAMAVAAVNALASEVE